MKNIILFGGAFDPIHNGHIKMAKEASEFLNAEVIFIPAKISVWKNESLPVEDKIKMIELAIKDSGKEDVFSISRYEADLKTDINYSINTIRHFKKVYPNDKLYLLIGLDQVNNFDKWMEASEISKLVQIVFYGRLNEEKGSGNIKRFSMINIPGEINGINSSDIRDLKSLDTPEPVIRYIIDHDLYFMENIKNRMSLDRYIHSKSVGLLSYEIAKSNHLKEPKKALVAGLIHDCGKELPREKEKQIMVEHYSEYINYPRVIYHQFTGEYIAKTEFGIEDEEILTSIKYHTTANSNIGEIGIIVYCADKIEPTRGFDSKDLIDAMKNNLWSGFKIVMDSNVDYYVRHGIDYKNPLTVAAIEQYYK
ncbi:MAG: nicotinate (nicotinamide) nucleotide adenylyltransferase [Bacilli bacterium]|nr:nicotinate (nicotinamide) nucleotide adenylyltransferase [Bacilli bacterium]